MRRENENDVVLSMLRDLTCEARELALLSHDRNIFELTDSEILDAGAVARRLKRAERKRNRNVLRLRNLDPCEKFRREIAD